MCGLWGGWWVERGMGDQYKISKGTDMGSWEVDICFVSNATRSERIGNMKVVTRETLCIAYCKSSSWLSSKQPILQSLHCICPCSCCLIS